MTPARSIQLAGILGMAACLAGAALLTGPIEEQRRVHQLSMVGTTSSHESSPVFDIMIAMGGPVRGFSIQYLWFKVEKLKEEGRYFALDRLCQFIAELQPNYPQAWDIMAWNLAYNVSVATKTKEERWDWVNKGVNLLRAKGIVFNPTAVVLYEKLGWTFEHKIGGNSDDAHYYYKYRLAYEWQEVLGEPDPSLSNEQQIARFQLVAQAPNTLDDLLKADEAPDQPHLVRPLLDRLAAIGRQPGEVLLREIGRVAMFNHNADAGALGVDTADLPELYGKDLVDLLRKQTPAQNKALDQLLNHLRKRVLIDTYHMDPQFMWELMRPDDPDHGVHGYEFGPLDFRAAGTHACYWSAMGVRQGSRLLVKDDLEIRNTYRQVIHAMQLLLDEGRIALHPVPPGQENRMARLSQPLALLPGQRPPSSFAATWSLVDLSPDTRFIDAYLHAIDEAQKDEDRGLLEKGDAENLKAGRENFLLKAVEYSYLYGQPGQAQKYYEMARRDYSQQQGKGEFYKQSLEDVVMAEAREGLEAQANARTFVIIMTHRAIEQGLLQGIPGAYEHFLEIGKLAHQKYEKTIVPTLLAPIDRQSLGPFDALLTDEYRKFMVYPAVPLLLRARVWANTPPTFADPPTLKQRVYDDVKPSLAKQCGNPDDLTGPPILDVNRAFPEPPGMEALRKPGPENK